MLVKRTDMLAGEIHYKLMTMIAKTHFFRIVMWCSDFPASFAQRFYNKSINHIAVVISWDTLGWGWMRSQCVDLRISYTPTLVLNERLYQRILSNSLLTIKTFVNVGNIMRWYMSCVNHVLIKLRLIRVWISDICIVLHNAITFQ